MEGIFLCFFRRVGCRVGFGIDFVVVVIIVVAAVDSGAR